MTSPKTSYREQAKCLLKNMSQNNKNRIESDLRYQLFHTDEWEKAETIGITISQALEWDTQSLIEKAWETGKRVVVPKCWPNSKTMTFYTLSNFDQLEVVYHNLLEPKPDPEFNIDKSQIDLLIVPGLMFDKKGYRIGFGGGYYDRFLNHFKQTSLSLLSSEQLVETLPTDDFDMPVDLLITQQGCLRTGGA